jgi:hypothetical protein
LTPSRLGQGIPARLDALRWALTHARLAKL